ncbi:ATP-binding cassette sub-family G member 1-like [Bombyx mandarina]|uniref:ATP-binding cassette sub-family G member 1-like n=1 Tax=Bombyx mandarina TaxID=7092 RepID=A0A6J2KGB6_BOMMA|nr:ATP-binding cassette sub-family G member 1-like [Bombyx mandarina]
MNIEMGSASQECGRVKAITFLDLGYKTTNAQVSGFPLCFNRKSSTTLTIINGACGVIRPGRLTFILGPSGAGKTTLLKIIAKRKKSGVTGSVFGANRNVVFVDQHTTLIETLTARETIKFAASLKLAKMNYRERIQTVESVTKQLGIYDILNTKCSRLSGGERKRLTIACELLTDPPIMLLDEPTSGLDTVSSLSVVRALQTVARAGRIVACVVHQPSSQLYATADDVLLLANGKTLYAGPLRDIPGTLLKAGLSCPQYYNMADYLLEVASLNHPSHQILESEARSYAIELRKNIQIDISIKNGEESSPESEALLIPYPVKDSHTYTANSLQQCKALLWRCFIGAVRDVHITQIRLATHLVVALLLGALYNKAGLEAHRIISNTGCLFFFLLFLFFSNAMPTIHTFPSESTVVLQQHMNRWYSLVLYCGSKIIVDLPIQLLCSTVFLIPAWYLTSQPTDLFRVGMAWTICVLMTILAQTFGLVVGAAYGMKLGLFIIPAANIPMLMFSEFFIPYKEIPTYLQPLCVISYFRYGFNAFLKIVYGYGREKLPCHVVFCMFKNPAKYLEYLGVSGSVTYDFLALVIWIVVLQITLVFVLMFKAYNACR